MASSGQSAILAPCTSLAPQELLLLRPMSLTRHFRRYLLVGGLQWLLDCAVMVALSAAGLGIAPANIAGRISGALLGFWLNGRYTFHGHGGTLGGATFTRFALMWLAMTWLGTWLLAQVDARLGLHGAWLAKPVVELLLGLAGFVLARQWVYAPPGRR